MKPTPEQQNVIDKILLFPKQVQTLGGWAGCGKSFVVSELKQKYLPNFAVCSYTGKAADVLRRKGIFTASTIHSLIYKPMIDNYGNIVLDKGGNPIFILAPELDCEGIIVDEASMVSQEIYEDLCSFGIPLVFVGDHGQLESIGMGADLMKNPDYTLETIHRNAGEIAHFAEFIRNGYRAAAFKGSGRVKFINKYDIESYFLKVNQIICAYNKTRVAVNKRIREMLGYGNKPVAGDRVMCLRNDKKKFIFNGMQGEIVKIHPKHRMTFAANNMEQDLTFDTSQFNMEKYDFGFDKDDPVPFDYAYCITCHKSEGDEFDKVMVLEQKCQRWSHQRWAYTAASRAKEELIWVEM